MISVIDIIIRHLRESHYLYGPKSLSIQPIATPHYRERYVRRQGQYIAQEYAADFRRCQGAVI